MRTNTINAQDIWNASTLEESGELLKALSKELFLLKEWHEWASKAEDLRERIISGEEFQTKHSLHTNIELLKYAEMMRNFSYVSALWSIKQTSNFLNMLR